MKKLIFASFLFVVMLMPYSSFSGTMPTLPPINPGCCQYAGEIGTSCQDVEVPDCPPPPFGSVFDGFFPGESCNQSGACGGVSPVAKNVPTMSEWGLIALAVVMGFVGYVLLRRRKAEV